MAVHKRANVYIHTFVNETTLVIPGTTHGLGTAWVGYIAYDDGYPTRHRIEEGTFDVDVPTHDVTLTFGTAKSGSVLLWG